ncbi:MAG: Na/Pi cotransporter family protein, partial [Candidatus Marinimicrobia bacterium]|nr:Na/Pi cotransporter family protein [Candidatus Neomarinimicrobiota bacterium]
GVILGADIGTTVTAQLIAFKFTDYALLMIAVGFILSMTAKKESTKHIGEAVFGFGILFFGMKLMGDTMKPLREIESFRYFLVNLNPFYALLTATLFTAIIQSSSAFTGIIIILAQQGLINLETGIPLLFGANIGTCVTAGLATIGTNRNAKRVALAHVIFKIGGVLLFFFWIPQFAHFIETISQKFGSMSIARQIANAHTIFNVSMAFIFLPFINYFSMLVEKLLPEEAEERGIQPTIFHLDESSLEFPATAIDLARSEISRMLKILGRMNSAVIKPFLSNEEFKDEIYPQLSITKGIIMREAKIDYLDEKVNEFLIQIGKREITRSQSAELYGYMSITNDIEKIGDIISKNLTTLIKKKQNISSDFSSEGKKELIEFHTKVAKQISRLQHAFSEKDSNKAKSIISKSEIYNNMETEFTQKHVKRMYEEKQASLDTHEVHMDLLDGLKMINMHTVNIAEKLSS